MKTPDPLLERVAPVPAAVPGVVAIALGGSAIWMGEVALCLPLSDPRGVIAGLQAMTDPYREQLGQALVRRFRPEVLFSSAIPRQQSRKATRAILQGARSARSRAPPMFSSLTTGAISSMRRARLKQRRGFRSPSTI